MILHRKVWVSAKDLTEPLRKALPLAKQWRIRPEMREHWLAWKAHYVAQKKGDWLSYCEKSTGYLFELTEWPPGHWRNNGETAEPSRVEPGGKPSDTGSEGREKAA